MITLILPALIALVGLLLYAFASNPKLSEVGRLTYFAGILVITFALAGRAIHFP